VKVQKFTAGTVFVPAVTAGMVGATPAFAGPTPTPSGPGISYQNGSGQPVTFGSGATADAKGTNSQALAINTGLNLFGKSPSYASARGDGATAVSIDGYTKVYGSNSHGFAALGQTNIGGAANNAVTLVGATNLYPQYNTENVDRNFVVNFEGIAYSQGQEVTDAGEASAMRHVAERSGCTHRQPRQPSLLRRQLVAASRLK
jgi:hypothetical protein